MIVYFGAMREFEHDNKESLVQNEINNIGTIGVWFTSDINSAKAYAIGTEKVFEQSDTEFWEDGEPKVIEVERQVMGFIYKAYIHEPQLKIYESNTFDNYELFMNDRDVFCDYFSKKKRKLTWKDHAILLNKEEANMKFRNHLIRQGYEGFLIPNCKQQHGETELGCLFSVDAFHISEIIPVDAI
ncbi:hypothetical protein [Evansella cellulosilytica]|uniref:Uncharacterized protein n=1 Tax=Evansella cellulosilytica (strain ATCC 21833 / DSM 2522 / FERM P-1141 / JCM 9156 / N-4) TaxID=649639 RepID=E6TRR9_EVAC2|nr:hypothetical protein [Evansella cellulosilytica]ADU29442.1 hypothetical protein Bcell_1177 [Evansella cellulosilytica DSM 2522]